MRVAITGVSGLLGRYLVGQSPQNIEVHGLSRGGWPEALDATCSMHQADPSDPSAIRGLLDSVAPNVLIHAAAEGRVDAVQGRLQEFRALNVGVSAAIAGECASRGIRFVFISSNAVFGGSPTPYRDDSPPDPINDYGILKAEAEEAVRSANPECLIIRPILMYGWPFSGTRLNPVVQWIERLRAGEAIRVVDDVITEPLTAWDCAAAVWRGVDLTTTGSINVSCGQAMTLYEFAVAVAEAFELDKGLVVPISSSSLPDIAPRPRQTTYDLTRLIRDLGIHPQGPREGLRTMRLEEDGFRRVAAS